MNETLIDCFQKNKILFKPNVLQLLLYLIRWCFKSCNFEPLSQKISKKTDLELTLEFRALSPLFLVLADPPSPLTKSANSHNCFGWPNPHRPDILGSFWIFVITFNKLWMNNSLKCCFALKTDFNWRHDQLCTSCKYCKCNNNDDDDRS